MKKKSFYLVLALIMMSAASVNAQVLIGGNGTGNPHAGAILDLASGGQNNLGLLLPNVKLRYDATEFRLVPDASDEVKEAATGMIVYNTAGVPDGRGLYVWNGNKWTPVGNTGPKFITDERDRNEYFIGDFGVAGTWMTQNLRYIVPRSSDYYYQIHVTDEEFLINGFSYNWRRATGRVDQSKDEGDGETNQDHATPQGICPIGWHVPSDKEWNELEKVIALSKEGEYSTGGPTIWNEEFRFSEVGRGAHGPKFINAERRGTSLDSSEGGFDGYPLGYGFHLNSNLVWYDGRSCYFWTSSMATDESFWARVLSPDGTATRIAIGIDSYLQVRCKKD
jgi:uncharacterized protein (TIGR02145 family)